ncbi:MAG: exopolysaccharide biosynthesis polyprenyl glycosylphosphotransferase [Verrucomicrobiota bacterium]
MIAYRQRGLVNVHAFLAIGVSVALMPIFIVALPGLFPITEAIPFLPKVGLVSSVDPWPLMLAVAFAMAASSPLVRRTGHALHLLNFWEALGLALQQSAYVAGCLFAFVWATKDKAISRVFVGEYLVLNCVVLTLLHVRAPRALARLLFSDKARMPTLLVGQAAAMENLDSWITNRGHLGIRVVGRISDEAEPTRAEQALAPYLGGMDRLGGLIREYSVGQVILLEWMEDAAEVEKIIQTCEAEGCRFLIYNNYGARFARSFTPVEEGGQHFLTFQAEPLEDPINRAFKRALDLAVSLPVVLFLLPPLAVVVWVVQRFQAPGSLFYTKPRGGQNRREFGMFKFRSMFAAGHAPGHETRQATMDDPRVYPFGRFLRRTSLDEIPQFVNVLIGDMSIVGPRPHLPQHDDEFSRIARAYRGRALVKPGITGLAQVRGYRGEITDSEKLHRRIYWDLYYVTHWTLLLDIQLIVRTAWLVPFPNEAAY